MTVIELAKRRAAAFQKMQVIGMRNDHGLTAEQQVEQSALYRLARDAARMADREYRVAIANSTACMTAEELSKAD